MQLIYRVLQPHPQQIFYSNAYGGADLNSIFQNINSPPKGKITLYPSGLTNVKVTTSTTGTGESIINMYEFSLSGSATGTGSVSFQSSTGKTNCTIGICIVGGGASGGTSATIIANGGGGGGINLINSTMVNTNTSMSFTIGSKGIYTNYFIGSRSRGYSIYIYTNTSPFIY